MSQKIIRVSVYSKDNKYLEYTVGNNGISNIEIERNCLYIYTSPSSSLSYSINDVTNIEYSEEEKIIGIILNKLHGEIFSVGINAEAIVEGTEGKYSSPHIYVYDSKKQFCAKFTKDSLAKIIYKPPPISGLFVKTLRRSFYVGKCEDNIGITSITLSKVANCYMIYRGGEFWLSIPKIYAKEIEP